MAARLAALAQNLGTRTVQDLPCKSRFGNTSQDLALDEESKSFVQNEKVDRLQAPSAQHSEAAQKPPNEGVAAWVIGHVILNASASPP